MNGSIAQIESLRILQVSPAGEGWFSRIIDRKSNLPTKEVVPLPHVSQSLSWRNLSRDIYGIREIVWMAPTVNRVQVVYRSGLSFFRAIAPAILIGRYFGKPVELLFESNQAEVDLESYGRAIIPFLRYCDRIVVSCDYTGRVLGQFGLKSEKVSHQIDRSVFKPMLRDSIQPRIVTARRLLRSNNLATAIKAFQLVKYKYPRAELIILGDGPQFDGLNWLVNNERISGVTFCGQVSQAVCASEFQQSDIYLNPASIDGLPKSLLEALACGLPVISTKMGDIPSVISHEFNGLLVDRHGFVAMADAVIRLVENPDLFRKLSSNAIDSQESLCY